MSDLLSRRFGPAGAPAKANAQKEKGPLAEDVRPVVAQADEIRARLLSETRQTLQRRTAAEGLPAVDVGRLVGDISRSFNPLAREFELDAHVSPLPGGYVQVSVALPKGMTRAFVALLESLSGLVRFVDNKARYSAAEVKAIDPEEIADRREVQEAYRAEVSSLFDGFTADGLDRKEAIRRTCQALKAKNHPWSTLDLVTVILRECGRFRKGHS